MSPGAGESGAGGGLPQNRRKLHPPGSDPSLVGVLGQQGQGTTVGLNGWKKEEVVSAKLPAATP